MLITAIGGGSKERAIRATLGALPTETSNTLLIPTACSVRSGFVRKGKAAQDFFGSLGVETTLLHDFDETPTPTQLQHEVGKAALIYTIGGNTPHLLRLIRAWQADIILASAIADGKPHSGISAGALLPFAGIHTNPSARSEKEDWDFKVLDGLGVLRGIATAHADAHDPTPHGPRPDSRLENLIATAPTSTHFRMDGSALGIDNGAAVIFKDTGPEIVRSVNEAQIHLLQQTANGNISVHAVNSGDELSIFMPQDA